jgi:hypothetical protein
MDAGAIELYPLDGGPPTPLVTGEDSPLGVAFGSGQLFWTNENQGGSVRVLGPDGGRSAVAGLTLTDAEEVDVDEGGTLYVTDFNGQRLVAKPPDAGARVLVDGGLGNLTGLAVRDGVVFFAGWSAGKIYAVSVDGGAPRVLASGYTHPVGVAVTPDAVYWTDESQEIVVRVAR